MDTPHRVCTTCGQSLPVSEFHKRAKSPDGLAYRCKACIRAYQRVHNCQPDVRERRAAYARKYLQDPANRERHCERQRAYHRRPEVQAKCKARTQDRTRRHDWLRALRYLMGDVDDLLSSYE